MKARILVLAMAAALNGCAASLKFIDRETGDIYLGKTGSTASGSGSVTADIAGEAFAGEWVYTPNGGGYTLATGSAMASGPSGVTTASGTVTGVTVAAKGDGMIHMKGASGHAMRCVFTFNSMSDSGMGECQRNDGRLFDVTIRR